MTPQQFRAQHDHGDYTTWTDETYELFELCATPGAPAPAEVLAFLKQPPPAKTPDTQPAT